MLKRSFHEIRVANFDARDECVGAGETGKMNQIDQCVFDALKQAFAQAMTIRAATRHAGCAKHTTLRYFQMFRGEVPRKHKSSQDLAIARAKTIQPKNSDGCVEATSVHMACRRRKSIIRSNGFDHGFTGDVNCGNPLCINREHVIERKWKMYRPPIATNPPCKYCGGGTWELFKNVTKVSKRTGEIVKHRPRGHYICRERGCGRAFYGGEMQRPYLPAKDPRTPQRRLERHLRIMQEREECRVSRHNCQLSKRARTGQQSIYLGQFRQTPEDVAFLALPRRSNCEVPGCAMPKHGDKVCRHHEHFFEYRESMEWRGIGYTDTHATEDQPIPTFTSLQGCELDRSAERVRFIHHGIAARNEDMGEKWLLENDPTYKPEQPITNIQHTGAFILWKGFGKRKIRKSQRKRPAGWHGNHPEQKPMYKEIERDTIAEWAPSGEDKPHVQHLEDELPTEYERYEIADDEYERDMAIAQIDDNFGFEERP